MPRAFGLRVRSRSVADMTRVILASASPRRRELLKMIVPEFEIASGEDVDETYPDDMPAEEVPIFLSKLKSDAYRHILTNGDVLITADTVVIVDGDILGKPLDRDDAIAMLEKLSGRSHKVITGVTLKSVDRIDSFAQATSVYFDDVARADIEHYVDTYRPYDKAGAYGIQEWIGAAAISCIEGSFYNVMGLPVHALFLKLKEFIW